jgi:hypothetical protein
VRKKTEHSWVSMQDEQRNDSGFQNLTSTFVLFVLDMPCVFARACACATCVCVCVRVCVCVCVLCVCVCVRARA